jgi:prolyl-tRNA editing enzyme YbaK/EbsC (Cys-tRNA(Pro) deacylase)
LSGPIVPRDDRACARFRRPRESSIGTAPAAGANSPACEVVHSRRGSSMSLKPSAQKVQDALRAAGFTNAVVELPDSARTAVDAATAVGCDVGQIVKSLLFQAVPSGCAVLVAASGSHRVDEQAVAAVVGERIIRASADFVRERTGFAIGGVPPIGHAQPVVTVVDEALLGYERIWAAAGHPHAVFALTPAELVGMTGGTVARVG